MSTTAVALSLTLAERDDLTESAAHVARRSCKAEPRRLADVLGVTYERGRQLCAGDRTGTPARALEWAASLSGRDGMTAAPLLVEYRVQMLKAMLRRQDEGWLHSHLREWQEKEVHAQARRGIAENERDEAAVLQAERDQAAALEEIVATKEVLRLREKGRRA